MSDPLREKVNRLMKSLAGEGAERWPGAGCTPK